MRLGSEYLTVCLTVSNLIQRLEATDCPLAILRSDFSLHFPISANCLCLTPIKCVHKTGSLTEFKVDRSVTVEHVTDLRLGCLKAYKL